MRAERTLIWLPLVGVVACSPGIVLLSATHHCWGLAALCQVWAVPLPLTPAAWIMLLSLLLPAVRGLYAGFAQLARTHRSLQHVRRLPRTELSEPLAAIVANLTLRNRLELDHRAEPDAFCYGLLRPRICVTTGLRDALSTAELEAVLRHERHHLRRYDPLRTLLWTMLDGACWWMENGAEHARLLRELAADRAVIAAGLRKQLASALLKLLAYSGGKLATSKLAIGGLSVTDARIDQLLRPDQPPPPRLSLYRWLAVPFVLILSTVLCSS